jgi:hypothetical protein
LCDKIEVITASGIKAMPSRKLIAFTALTIALGGCSTVGQQTPTEPQVPDGVGKVAQHAPLSGPPGCTRAITEYEKIVDRDVNTGYLEQKVYNQIVSEIDAGPRPACVSGRDADALNQLKRVKSSHGYR